MKAPRRAKGPLTKSERMFLDAMPQREVAVVRQSKHFGRRGGVYEEGSRTIHTARKLILRKAIRVVRILEYAIVPKTIQQWNMYGERYVMDVQIELVDPLKIFAAAGGGSLFCGEIPELPTGFHVDRLARDGQRLHLSHRREPYAYANIVDLDWLMRRK